MSYIEEKLLSADDKIIMVPKKSAVQLVLAWIWGVLGCWLILIPTIRAIIKTVQYNTLEFAITEKKIMEKSGAINVHADEMLYSKIENISINTSFLGRIFNYGSIFIQGANYNNIDLINIKDPYEVKKKIESLIQK